MPYCHNCGADLQSNAAFCAKCGAPVAATSAATPSAPPSYRYGSGYEKREKQEKQTRQSEKYEKREKSGDRTGPLIGGGILILIGLIYYASITTPPLIPSSEFWAYFFLGLGILLILQAVYRFTMQHHAAGMGALWGGVILAAIGAAGIVGSGNFWPIVLIAIGVMVIVAGVTSRSRAPRPA